MLVLALNTSLYMTRAALNMRARSKVPTCTQRAQIFLTFSYQFVSSPCNVSTITYLNSTNLESIKSLIQLKLKFQIHLLLQEDDCRPNWADFQPQRVQMALLIGRPKIWRRRSARKTNCLRIHPISTSVAFRPCSPPRRSDISSAGRQRTLWTRRARLPQPKMRTRQQFLCSLIKDDHHFCSQKLLMPQLTFFQSVESLLVQWTVPALVLEQPGAEGGGHADSFQ